MDTIRRTVAELERKGQRAKEKVKNMLRPHTPGPTASSRESLRAHSPSPPSHPRALVELTADERDNIDGGTTIPFNTVHRSTSRLSIEHMGIDLETSRSLDRPDVTRCK
jgi:hypothetical protein